MPHPIEARTLRILKPTGETVGTGFLVSKNLAVTCAHVVKILAAGAGDTIDIRFTGKSAATTGRVLPEYWRPDDATDIAILQVDEVPAGVFPLRMGRASESRLKNDLYTFGYAIAGDEQGIGCLGTFITLKQEGNFIQFRMHEANHGHSGAPIYDDKRGVVVGMVKKGHTGTGRNAETTFAIPTETIWQICPQLKPIVSPLPRRNPIVEGINLLPYDYDVRIQNFLTEYLGTDSHPVPFGGRDDALKMLDTWLAETTPYLLLAAPAGRGKSALLVRWLDSLSTREDLALAFVPVSIRFGTNMERVFYAALAARLAFLHGDDIPASPETSTAVYRGLVADYLSKPLANGRMLLVVLDGLDEAADWQAGADFMPGELPAEVRVVVSARFLAGDAASTPWLRRLNWERKGLASAPSLTPIDHDGVRDVLFKVGCPLDELSRRVDIVTELYRLSEGDPLLVGLYVGDLWAKGDEVTRLKPEDLAGIQPGYKGYFDRWWDDQKKLWGKEKPWLEKHVRTVRSLLAGAIGPLFRYDFQSLDTELDSDFINDALDVLQRFILGDNQTQGYTFSHPKLGQYFWEALTQTEQAQVEERFLAWGEQTLQEFIDGKRDPKKKTEVPVYGVRNYSAHLTRAKSPIEKWLPLTHHQQWAQAWFTVEGAYGGYSQDVQRIWEQCRILDRQAIQTTEKVPYLGQQIRCALIKSSLHSLAGNIPTELIPVLVRQGLWTLPQTWVFIRQMPEIQKQAESFIALIPNLDEKQIPEILKAAWAIQPEHHHASMLSALVPRLHEPELGQVLAAARAIQDEGSRAQLLIELAQHLAETELEQILAAARAIQNEGIQAYVLSKLAQRLPELSGEALAATRAIRDDWDRASVLRVLAQRLPETELGQVLAAVRAISSVGHRASVLNVLAQRLPELSGEVLVATRALEDEGDRAHLLSALAQRLPELSGEALAAARVLQNDGSRARVLSVLAQRLPELSGEALAAAQAIQGERDRARVLSKLAQRLPETELEQVLAAVRAIQDEGSRARVLSVLAQRMPEITGEALAAAQAIHDEEARAHVLSALAQRLPELSGEALAAARAIQDEWYRVRALSELAQHLPESELGQILKAARAIQDEWSRTSMLGILAQRLPELSGEVLVATRALQNDGDRADVLSALAQCLPETELEQILAAAWEIQDEGSRADVLSELAQRMPETELGQVLAAARTIQHKYRRAYVLSELAQRMPELSGEALVAAQVLQAQVPPYASVLSGLAHRLPESKLEQILKAARAIQSEYYRARVLSALAQRLPELSGETLAAARAIQDEGSLARVLSELAQRLPETELGQILEVARAIQDERDRARVLSELAQRLPETELGQVLAAVRAIQDEGSRARVLSVLAQRLPELSGEALATTRALDDEGDRPRVLSALAQPLSKVSMLECYLMMEPTLIELALRTRHNLFSDISALLSVFFHLGTNEVAVDILQSVHDVTEWWP